MADLSATFSPRGRRGPFSGSGSEYASSPPGGHISLGSNLTPRTPQSNGVMQDLATATEVQRKAQEWEKQIESLDAKEMEIHQTQLRLIKEQTASFRHDFMIVRKELNEMKAAVVQQTADTAEVEASLVIKLSEMFAKERQEVANLRDELTSMKTQLRGHDVHESLKDLKEKMDLDRSDRTNSHGRLERQCQDLAETLGRHGRLHEDTDRKLASHRQTLERAIDSSHGTVKELLGKHANDTHQRHASTDERLAFLEKALGDSADKHDRHLQEIQNLQRNIREVSSAHDHHGRELDGLKLAKEHHASLQERVVFLEKTIGDSADKHTAHTRALEEVRKASDAAKGHHSDQLDRLSREKEALHAKHASVEERLKFLETSLGDSADRHHQELKSTHSKIDQLHSKLADEQRNREHHQSSTKDIVNQHISREQEKRDRDHASLQDRMKFLEKAIGDSADKHARELEMHKGQRDAQHATVEERLKYVEQVIGDSADRHTKLLEAQRREIEEHKRQLTDHKREFQDHKSGFETHKAQRETHHASLDERVNFLEKSLGDSADKHEQAQQKNQEQLEKHRREALEHKSRLEDHKVQGEKKHANLEQRLDYIEKLVGDSADRHAKMLEETKAGQAKHGTLESRLEYLEKWFGGLPGFRPPRVDELSMSW
mmetsp:Transcript_28375/g.51223  ORF Transcript_28375/g.51223 Transcript_28375/m.51223 type:complete len:660 (+) Transcript_28375:57-2036(+)|eukprot:CAMPEP_0197629180 /NCGR_PEP_ID=MMETSP1338-20131121/7146_1 /TAXON_ID=43686 ORGANISM="Pelagodinium beii, Strain RCC1491" /NCGR_SAMPLE_ID=MMETSP1338 /ASSEMBLY_ACC=CAM_ASM_000754 /LENGTH=659 /DNA_ID=CAMNT_0043200203 /DNA_START=42 /DNA_END=2021 /DNA_ORIENTATION=-